MTDVILRLTFRNSTASCSERMIFWYGNWKVNCIDLKISNSESTTQNQGRFSNQQIKSYIPTYLLIRNSTISEIKNVLNIIEFLIILLQIMKHQRKILKLGSYYRLGTTSRSRDETNIFIFNSGQPAGIRNIKKTTGTSASSSKFVFLMSMLFPN